MFVTLLVTVCLNLGVPGSRVTEPVVNSKSGTGNDDRLPGARRFRVCKRIFGNTTPFIATGNLSGGHFA
jgi:hypothetical protein